MTNAAAVFTNGNAKPDAYQSDAYLAARERLGETDPREMSREDFASLGFAKRPLLAVIRDNCIGCQGGNSAEVRRCSCTTCQFWPYRMGTDPFTDRGKNLTDEQRQAIAERMKRTRPASQHAR